jgi:hypothetical protein
MKKFIYISGFFLISGLVYGQSVSQQSAIPLTRSDVKAKNYIVSGVRHGVSFFPKVEFKSVQYIAGDTLSFDKYHSLDVIYIWLKRWAEAYPELIELYEVGKSFEGRPILQITLTNKKSGKDTDKPAAFFEGG